MNMLKIKVDKMPQKSETTLVNISLGQKGFDSKKHRTAAVCRLALLLLPQIDYVLFGTDTYMYIEGTLRQDNHHIFVGPSLPISISGIWIDSREAEEDSVRPTAFQVLGEVTDWMNRKGLIGQSINGIGGGAYKSSFLLNHPVTWLFDVRDSKSEFCVGTQLKERGLLHSCRQGT